MNRSSRSIVLPNIRVSTMTVVFTLMVVAGLAQADDHEANAARLKYRQSVMSIIGTNMGAIGDIMKNGLALPGHVAVHAGEMANMAQLIAPAFKKNVEGDATDAKPKIWKDWTKFESAIADFEEAARTLETAANGPDAAAVGPAMKALGKSCGGCHKQFRRPKEESFRKEAHNHDHDDGDE
jgi:cytochrome c556